MARWSWSGVALFLRVFSLGCVLTVATNFPAAFTHTSFNTAFHLVNHFVNVTYTKRGWEVTSSDAALFKSFMNNIWYAAQIVGALLSPQICDRYGRKVAYVASLMMMTAGAALQAAAAVILLPELLLTGRLLTALFSPLSDAALILYLQEVSPTHLRGTVSSLFSTGYAVMCLVGMRLGEEGVLGHSLPVLLSVPLPTGILSVLTLLAIPETPKFLLSRGDRKGALASLVFFQGRQPEHEAAIDTLAQETGGEDGKNHTDNSSFKSIVCSASLRKALWLSVAALILTLPFYPILQNSTHFFETLKIPRARAQLQSTSLMVLLALACVLATCLIDHLGRRCLLLLCAVAANVSLVAFAVFAHFEAADAATVAIFFFVLAYGVGIGPVVWCLPGELVPISARSSMFCICYAAHSLLVVASNFVTLPLFDLLGGGCFLFIFVVPAMACMVVLLLWLPETKGREIGQLMPELRSTDAVLPVDTSTESLDGTAISDYSKA